MRAFNFGYWNLEPVYVQVKRIMAAMPKLSRKEALSMVARPTLAQRTNPWRPRMQGSQEVARRKMQIEKGFIRANG